MFNTYERRKDNQSKDLAPRKAKAKKNNNEEISQKFKSSQNDFISFFLFILTNTDFLNSVTGVRTSKERKLQLQNLGEKTTGLVSVQEVLCCEMNSIHDIILKY